MKIAYVVYPDFTGLDLVGPYELISRWPGVDVRFLASRPGPVRADRGLTVVPTDTPETLPDEALQLIIEYDPEPPLDSGSLEKASPATIRLAKRVMLGEHPLQKAAQITGHVVKTRVGRARRALAGRRS